MNIPTTGSLQVVGTGNFRLPVPIVNGQALGNGQMLRINGATNTSAVRSNDQLSFSVGNIGVFSYDATFGNLANDECP